jgi:CRISPR-associated endoribonuclease Cas6
MIKMNKKYHEVTVMVYLNNNIEFADVNEKISKLINYSFNNSQVLSCLHKSTGLKHYNFSWLYPIEKDKCYKADEIYSFLFRSHDIKLINEFIKCIDNIKNDDFIVTNVILKSWDYKEIDYVDNLTPTVITLKDGIRWNKETHGTEVAFTGLFNNLIKKYNSLNNTNFNFSYSDIIKDIEVKSNIAIVFKYKGILILGYKFRIRFQENSIAQEIANMAVIEGIGEKNSSMGAGFVKPYFKRGGRTC